MIAPLATAAAVALVASGVVLLVRATGSDSGSRPPMLHLAGYGAAQAANADAAAAGSLGLPREPGFRVEGTLPTGPTRGRVRTLVTGAAPRQDVVRLAAALGVSGTPVRRGDGWTVDSGGTELRVVDGPGWRWTLGGGIGVGIGGGTATGVACDVIVSGKRACPPVSKVEPPVPAPSAPRRLPGPPDKVIPVVPPAGAEPNVGAGAASDAPATAIAGSAGSASEGSASAGSASVGSASGGGSVGSTGSAGSTSGSAVGKPPIVGTAVPVEPPPNLPRPSVSAIRQDAGPRLAALGLGGATIRVDAYPALGMLTAAPVVDGLPTSGYETTLSYDARAHLTGGSGWLGATTPGAEYPLISARKALDAVPGLPVPALAEIPCMAKAPSGCRPVQPVITGARPGLLLTWEASGTAILVPAWLFDVRGWTMPLAAIAVDPSYLAPPGTSVRPGVPTQIPPVTPEIGSAVPAPGTATKGTAVPVPAPTTR